jgi:hypothetical protein
MTSDGQAPEDCIVQPPRDARDKVCRPWPTDSAKVDTATSARRARSPNTSIRPLYGRSFGASDGRRRAPHRPRIRGSTLDLSALAHSEGLPKCRAAFGTLLAPQGRRDLPNDEQHPTGRATSPHRTVIDRSYISSAGLREDRICLCDIRVRALGVPRSRRCGDGFALRLDPLANVRSV